MTQRLGHVALVVRDYGEAIAFYTQSLGFQLIEDTDLGNGKRWVLVRPPGSTRTDVLLARAVTPEQASRIGNQTGGRVFLFLHTDDFWRDYREFTARGVKFAQRRILRNGRRVRGPLRQPVGSNSTKTPVILRPAYFAGRSTYVLARRGRDAD
jgi:catechol 2,3-dioxygenase-like lactoylglutathione lyase family enzyme